MSGCPENHPKIGPKMIFWGSGSSLIWRAESRVDLIEVESVLLLPVLQEVKAQAARLNLLARMVNPKAFLARGS